jgi:hypothetical protein
MAKHFPSNIDRRLLLIWTAAFAVFRTEPGVECAQAANVNTAAQPLVSAPGVQGLNVCAGAARRLLEIEQRNEIRRSARLPLLSIPKELRRMKQQEVSKEFERFSSAPGRRQGQRHLGIPGFSHTHSEAIFVELVGAAEPMKS